MKKRLRFLYRYFTQSRRWRRWINAQTVMVVLVSAFFLAILSWTAPISADTLKMERQPAARDQVAAAGGKQGLQGITQATDTPISGTPEPSLVPTRTLLPPEYYHTDEQSIGISVGALVLALVVVFGVLAFMPRKKL